MFDAARLRAALPQLRDAVVAIHAAGKLHRDLKPSNVLVTRDGRIVVLDFGLAVDPTPGGVGQTLVDHNVSGTPAYTAPEQAAGLPATAASDFYALGVMLFEALTGKPPFEWKQPSAPAGFRPCIARSLASAASSRFKNLPRKHRARFGSVGPRIVAIASIQRP